MKLATLQELNQARAARRAVVLVKSLETGADTLVEKAAPVPDGVPAGAVARAFQSGKGAVVDEGRWFVSPYLPPPRLVIVGAVHISQALAPMAAIAGLDCVIVDPRTAFATPERFPGVDIRADWPEDVLPEIALDPFTAMAALTHDPKIDDPALKAALGAQCFYVGALGSRKTHGKRMDRLAAAGLSAEALERIAAPIGLAINAATPAEIAVAVLAEIIAALRRPVEASA